MSLKYKYNHFRSGSSERKRSRVVASWGEALCQDGSAAMLAPICLRLNLATDNRDMPGLLHGN